MQPERFGSATAPVWFSRFAHSRQKCAGKFFRNVVSKRPLLGLTLRLSMSQTSSFPCHGARSSGGPGAALVVVLLATVCICLCVHTYGWQSGWRIWGVHTGDVAWLDLKVITAAVQTASEGGDPYVANPYDPTGRAFNYPSAWLHLFANVRSSGAIATFAFGFAIAAVMTALLWVKSSGMRTGAFAGVLMVSPSLLLGVERGNTDLAIFALTGLAVLSIYSRHRVLSVLGVPVLLTAGVLKLYPSVVLLLVATLGPATVRRGARVALVVLAGWLGLNWRESLMAIGNTQIGAVHSYGREVLPFAIDLYFRSHGQAYDGTHVTRFFLVFSFVLLGGAIWLGYRLGKSAPLPDLNTYREIGWLAAALIYVPTFLAGFSFNYRLWFLLFSLAWLIPLAGLRHPAAVWARISLASMVVLLFASAVWWLPLVWVAQTASWLLFAAFSVLLASGCASRMKTGPSS